MENQINLGTRLGSMVLDHFIMTIIAMIFFVPGFIATFANAFDVSHDQHFPDIFAGFGPISLIGLAIYLCKDSLNGQSIAKRVLKLQVVNNNTGVAASPLKCFIRNIFCILWPIEVIITLGNTSRRLGDQIAGTRVVALNGDPEKSAVNVPQILLSLALAFGIMYVFYLPFEFLKSVVQQQRITYVESSINESAAREMAIFLEDNLDYDLSADVRIYDKIQDQENLSYISIILKLEQNYMEDSNISEDIKSAVNDLVLSKYPEDTFQGRIQYVYQSVGHRTIQTTRLGKSDYL